VSKSSEEEGTIANLALILLSIRPNTASLERHFSVLGNIHTRRRNRLSLHNLKMLGFIKMENLSTSNQGMEPRSKKARLDNYECEDITDLEADEETIHEDLDISFYEDLRNLFPDVVEELEQLEQANTVFDEDEITVEFNPISNDHIYNNDLPDINNFIKTSS